MISKNAVACKYLNLCITRLAYLLFILIIFNCSEPMAPTVIEQNYYTNHYVTNFIVEEGVFAVTNNYVYSNTLVVYSNFSVNGTNLLIVSSNVYYLTNTTGDSETESGHSAESFTAMAEYSTYSNAVRVHWEQVDSAYTYQVYKSYDASSYIYIGDTTGLSFYDKDPMKDAPNPYYTYVYYRLRAVFPGGEYSDYSIYSWGRPGILAPTATLTSDAEKLTLNWKQVEGADSYLLQKSSDRQNYFHLIETSNTQYVDRNTLPGTQYYYRISSKSVILGKGTYNSVYGSLALSEVNNLQIENIQNDENLLTWNPLPSADYYEIHRSALPDRSSTLISSQTSNHFQDTNLQSAFYYYDVYAVAVNGLRSSPTRASMKTGPLQILSFNTWTRTDIFNAGDVHWLRFPSVSGGRYNIYFDDNSGSLTLNGRVRYYNSDLTRSIDYSYGNVSSPDTITVSSSNVFVAVYGHSADDTGTASVKVTPFVNFQVTRGDTNLSLNWHDTGAPEYFVFRSTSPLGDFLQIGSSISNSFIDDTAGYGLFYYKVSTINGDPASSAIDYGYTKLLAPTLVEVSLNQAFGISLSWNSVNKAVDY